MPTSGQFVTGETLTAADTNSLLTRGYQNRIINGAFVINQRAYTSGTNLASGSYGFDRWKSGYTNTSLTFTAGSQSTTVTISASGVIQQIIERENMPAGTYTLSWAGTATGRVYNSGGTAPSYAASPVTVTLDGTANVVVEFTASGGTKTCSLVQLEAGSVYSPFEYRLRGDELNLCLRYFWRHSPRTNDTNVGMSVIYTGNLALGPLMFPVAARTNSPTVTASSGTALEIVYGTGVLFSTAVAFGDASQYSAQYAITISGGTVGQAGLVRYGGTADYVQMSDEL
jgi:hypothetical protein